MGYATIAAHFKAFHFFQQFVQSGVFTYVVIAGFVFNGIGLINNTWRTVNGYLVQFVYVRF